MNLFPLVANTIIVSVLVLSASAQTGYRISTVAGNGQIGSAGDGGPATLAAITSPRDFAIDGQGNYYIADTGNQFIRKITPAGIISIIAGNGFGTPIVDNVPAAQSAVPFPTGLAFDGHGNLYVTTLNRVRMITPQGYISTVAGTGVAGSTGDNGPALQATFSNLKGIVVDSAGAIFVSDGSNNRIRKIANGIVTTYAGTGGPFFSGDNGPATSATIWGPEGLALDATGNLYIADGLNHRVRKVTPAGTISTVAGNGGLTDPEEGAPATSGRLHWPVGITLDSNGNLFLTEWSAAKIKEVNPQGQIHTVAGTGANGFSGDGGPALLANINLPRGPRTDAAGNVFFADEGNNRIRRLTPSSAITVTPTSFSFPAGGGANYLLVNSPSSSWTAASNVSWIVITGSNKTPGAGTLQFNVDANPNPESRTGAINIDGVIVTVAQEGTESSANSPVRFVPVTPCRVLDSRTEGGKSGAFGPPVLSADSTRDIPVPSSNCGIPSSAKAYSLNVTVVPAEGLGYLSLWPTGKQQPVVSTLNSPAGKVVANAAIVPAGVNGAISVYVTNRTHLILDINGYFTAATSTEALSFYTTTPCRALETRIAYRAAGPLGAPSLTGGVARDFPLSSSPCGVPSTAKAYSVNATVVPPGPLSYLTVWPTGITQPLVSTLNSFDGRVVANAAIVPAGTAGNVSVFATNNTDLLLDVNGYFAPPAANALSFVPVTPCRVADTRDGQGFDGLFGPPVMAAGAIRSFPIPLGRCSIPSTANAYSLNITVVPHGGLPYLSIWPGGQAQPVVSTLNSFDGSIVANAALVPAGSGGGVNIYVANTTDVIIDINGYFTQ